MWTRSAIPKDVIIAGIMQHIEEAGIHSGDSSCVLPAVSIREETLETLRTYTRKLALALKVVGLVNLQFAIQRDAEGEDHVYVIEVNPRASRTVPYVSKATGIPLAKIAARLMTGRKLSELLPAQLAARQGSRNRHAFLCEVAGLSLEQICRRGYGSGPGDALDRRSDGRGRDLWRGLCQGAAFGRPGAAHRRHGLLQRQRSTTSRRSPTWRGAMWIWASRLWPPRARRMCWRGPA